MVANAVNKACFSSDFITLHPFRTETAGHVFQFLACCPNITTPLVSLMVSNGCDDDGLLMVGMAIGGCWDEMGVWAQVSVLLCRM